MTSLARAYFTSFLVLLTVIKCSPRYHEIQQPCQCSMDVIHVGDACSCPKELQFDVEAPRPLEAARRQEHGYRVEVPVLEDTREPANSYHVEVEMPVDARGPSPAPAYGFRVDVPRPAARLEKLHSYGFDVHVPKRHMTQQHQEYPLHIDRMAVPRRDCCLHH